MTKLIATFPDGSEKSYPAGGESKAGDTLILDEYAWRVTHAEVPEVSGSGAELTVLVNVVPARRVRRGWEWISERERHLFYIYEDDTAHRRAGVYHTAEGPWLLRAQDAVPEARADAEHRAELICDEEDALHLGPAPY